MRSILLALIAGIAIARAQPEAVVYAGLTPTGWQIFRLDVETRKSVQVTFAPGDMRRPQTALDGTVILCRDSLGNVWRIRGTNRPDRLFPEWAGCGHFAVLPDASAIVFTRLATDNRQRQFAWEQALGNPEPRLLHRPDRGAFRYLALSRDGRKVAGTHLWRLNEERVQVFSRDNPGDIRYVTPEFTIAASPSWSAEGGGLYVSQQQASANHDLFSIQTASGHTVQLTDTPAASEFYPCSDRRGEWLYYEERTGDGCHLARLHLKSRKYERLDLPHEAREPVCLP